MTRSNKCRLWKDNTFVYWSSVSSAVWFLCYVCLGWTHINFYDMWPWSQGLRNPTLDKVVWLCYFCLFPKTSSVFRFLDTFYWSNCYHVWYQRKRNGIETNSLTASVTNFYIRPISKWPGSHVSNQNKREFHSCFGGKLILLKKRPEC